MPSWGALATGEGKLKHWAEHLMGSIIVDKPQVPSWWALAIGEAIAAGQSASRSTIGGRSSKRKSRSPSKRTGPSSHRPQAFSRSPSDSKLVHEPPTMVKGILKPSTSAGEPVRMSSSDLHLGNLASLSAEGLSVDSSADIINYARQILEMEGTSAIPGDFIEISDSPPPAARIRQASQSPARETKKAAAAAPPQAKLKSFADMVRLQRPAATRKWQEVNRQRQQKAEEDARQAANKPGQKMWTLQDPNLVNGQPKEYGSKKIPGSSPRHQAVATPISARRVKTYAERLQEMKPSSKVYSPPASRGRPASGTTQFVVRGRT
ncbi:hypothetical protein PoB_004750800 [Plakobranchus ocellatus]|uniref:Uncharacterized protein n=1 Tax=Plakobranchus ocellatus TaxID=259542 RepID=A0AAV4BPF7_9GAST|nr:hypothetical protein PoB_004750800 [Plakobranchus ocellatus]